MVERIKEDPNKVQQVIVQFFIWAFLFEIIPIFINIYGFNQVSPAESLEQLYMPGILILLIVGFAAFFIFLQRTVDIEEKLKEPINMFALIAFALVASVPILSIVGLLMMVP